MKKIRDMKNLGPAVEKDLNASGIFYADEVKQLGAEKTFMRMLEGRQILGKSASCCNALYLYAIYGAIHDIDWREIPLEKKVEFKAFTKTLRQSGQFK